jgi:hypothetical protein
MSISPDPHAVVGCAAALAAEQSGKEKLLVNGSQY